MIVFFRWLRIVWLHLLCHCRKDLSVPAGAIVIVAPHPDDEVMGCSGLIQRLRSQGRDVHVVVMTGGEGSHRECCDTPDDQIRNARRKLCLDIDGTLGIGSDYLHLLNFPDGGIAEGHEATGRLRSLLVSIRPAAVFVPHWGEGWPDHLNTRTIVRSILGQDTEVFEYCVWLWYYNVWQLDWKHARVLRMTREEHEGKRNAVDGYVTPMAPCGKPWSGVLPGLLLAACMWDRELYFRYE